MMGAGKRVVAVLGRLTAGVRTARKGPIRSGRKSRPVTCRPKSGRISMPGGGSSIRVSMWAVRQPARSVSAMTVLRTQRRLRRMILRPGGISARGGAVSTCRHLNLSRGWKPGLRGLILDGPRPTVFIARVRCRRCAAAERKRRNRRGKGRFYERWR